MLKAPHPHTHSSLVLSHSAVSHALINASTLEQPTNQQRTPLSRPICHRFRPHCNRPARSPRTPRAAQTLEHGVWQANAAPLRAATRLAGARRGLFFFVCSAPPCRSRAFQQHPAAACAPDRLPRIRGGARARGGRAVEQLGHPRQRDRVDRQHAHGECCWSVGFRLCCASPQAARACVEAHWRANLNLP